MAVSQRPGVAGLATDDLPLDVFELVDSGLEVESLTAGHGMPENGASFSGCYPACCSCGCASCLDLPDGLGGADGK
jgi:hypothetical protein